MITLMIIAITVLYLFSGAMVSLLAGWDLNTTIGLIKTLTWPVSMFLNH